MLVVLDIDQLCRMPSDEAATLLMIRRAEGSTIDAPVLAAWLARDPENATSWARTVRAWQAFDESGDDELLAALRSHARAAKPDVAWRRPVAAGLAAALVVGVLAFGFSGGLLSKLGGQPGPSPVQMASTSREYAAAAGPPAAFQLEDGSRMTLESGSRARATFSPQRRTIQLLRGRAFFEVEHNAARPFTVQAGAQQVTALGTRFDVMLRPDQVRVVLVEGRLAVRSGNTGGSPILMLSGQQLVAPVAGPPMVSPADIDATLAWRTSLATFDNTPLPNAIAELNRHSDDQLVIRDPRVAALRVSGAFQTGNAARFGRSLAQILPIRIVRIGPHRLEIVLAH